MRKINYEKIERENFRNNMTACKFDNWIKNRDIREFNKSDIEKCNSIKDLDNLYNELMK